jgi:hypothetical protein
MCSSRLYYLHIIICLECILLFTFCIFIYLIFLYLDDTDADWV